MRSEPLPTRRQAIVFTSKVQALRLRRTLQNFVRPVAQKPTGSGNRGLQLIAESRTPLYSETDPREKRLQLGKVHNLRLVASRFDGIKLRAGETLSFWSQVGRPSRSRGFVEGRQIQEGCVIPATAGGICQLSNALYDVALKSGMEIVERHPHTRALARAAWSLGRDATVAWNHIDLRVRAVKDTILKAKLTRNELVVQLFAKDKSERIGLTLLQSHQTSANSCETCGMSDCHQHRSMDHTIAEEKCAAIVDQVWPEFVQIVNECNIALMPIDGERVGIARYSWTLDSTVQRVQSRWIALQRSWASRRLAEQGAERQCSNLAFDERLANDFAKKIPYEVTHVIVQQNLLPFLWRTGALGGRTFDVLMTRRPLATLQDILDKELEQHPERKLLGDFRADTRLLRDEEEALSEARRIYTPHSAIAAEFADRAVLLDWCLPVAQGYKPGDRVAFPGPTIARKGAYELKKVAQRLGLQVQACGSELEGPDFWRGVDVRKPSGDWLGGCCVVVQPAILEDQPRRLLRAVAEGVPVVTTPACGLDAIEGVTVVQNERELQEALIRLEVPRKNTGLAPHRRKSAVL